MVTAMSEEYPTYRTANSDTEVNPRTLLRSTDPGYERPTYADLRALKDRSGETGGRLAQRVGVDPRTWRKWTAPPEAKNAQQIPYAAWRLLLVELGVVEGLDDSREPVKLNTTG